MSAKIDNPIGRLHNVIYKIYNSTYTKPYDVLADAFNLDKDDSSTILEVYSQLFILCSDCRIQINNLKKADTEKLLAPINKVTLALSTIHFDESDLYSFTNKMSPELLDRLDLCSELLSVACGETLIDEDTLSVLSQDLKSIIDSVTNANINSQLKSNLLEKLKEILLSINNYTLFGSDSLQKAVEASMGCLILNTHLVNTDEEYNQMKTIFAYMNKLSETTSFSRIRSDALASAENHFLISKSQILQITQS